MPAGVPEPRVKEKFGDALCSEDPEFSCWHLQYAGEINCCDVFFSRHEGHSDQIKSLMVSRPIAEDRLWDSLFRIMQLGNFILFFPGGKSALIADPEALRHFPTGMVDDLGGAIVIRRGADIVAAIETA